MGLTDVHGLAGAAEHDWDDTGVAGQPAGLTGAQLPATFADPEQTRFPEPGGQGLQGEGEVDVGTVEAAGGQFTGGGCDLGQ